MVSYRKLENTFLRTIPVIRILTYLQLLTCIFYHAYGVLIYETHYGLLICLFIRLSVPCHFLTSYFYRLT